MAIPHVENPGRCHEVTTIDGVYHVFPTDEFARRFNTAWIMPFLATVTLIPMVFMVKWEITLVVMLGIAAWWILYAIIPSPAREPLIVDPNGRIEYRGRELRRGAAQAIRLFRREQGGDDPATYHIEILSEGSVLELPEPDFGKAEDAGEVAVLAAWLAQVLGAPLEETIGEGPTVGEERG